MTIDANYLWNLYHEQGKNIFFGKIDKDNKGYYYRQIQHISPECQKLLVDSINRSIKNKKKLTIELTSTKDITSSVLEGVSDLSKLKVKIEGGFHYLNGKTKAKYGKKVFDDRITYTGYEALVILKKIEALEAKIDQTLPPTEKARQISDIVAREYRFSQKFCDNRLGYSFEDRHNTVASLKGITSYNILGEEGLVCAGYAQLYKELCNRSGIQCDYIRGIAIDRFDGTRGVHAWNVVIGTNGEEIPVDCTWKATDRDPSLWFGQSDEFSFTHIADKDEAYKKYDPILYIEPKNEKIAYIKKCMEDKYGKGSINPALIKYLATNDDTLITNSGNAREVLLSVSNDEIIDYFNHIPRNTRTDAVLMVIENMLEEFYGPYAKKQFDYFTETGDTDFFPPGLKLVSERWLDRSDIMNYCNKQEKKIV